MLDTFLEVSYRDEQAKSLRNEMAEAMTALPNDMLHKLASGEEKLAFHGDKEGGCWLDQFQGTPLYEQAIQLEEKSIELEAQDQQQRVEDRAGRDQIWDARDAVRLKKRMLELELRKGEGVGEGEEPDDNDDEPALVEEEKAGAVALGSVLIASMRKQAAKSKEKKSSVDPNLIASMCMRKIAASRTNTAMQVADQWGREMAHMSQMEKEAFGQALMQAGKALWGGAKSLGSAAKAGWGGQAVGGGGKLLTRAAGPVKPGMAAPLAEVGGGLRGAMTGVGRTIKSMDPRVAMGLGATAAVPALAAGYAMR